MSDSVDASVLYDAPLFTVAISAGTTFMRIPDFASVLAYAIHPRMAGELELQAAMAADNKQREKPSRKLKKDSTVVAAAGPFQERDEASPEDVVLRRECTRIFHELGMQMDLRRSKIRFLSPVTLAPMTVGDMGKPPSQKSIERAMVPVCDLVDYAARFLVKVTTTSSAENDQPGTTPALEKVKEQTGLLEVPTLRQEAVRQITNQKGNAFLRLPEVMARTGLPKASIYSMKNRGLFPVSINLGGRKVGWLEVDIEEWINQRCSSASDRD